MVKNDLTKNTFRMIPIINRFLARHSAIIAVGFDYAVKFLTVSLFLVFGGITVLGLANIFFFGQQALGLFQLLFVYSYFRYLKVKFEKNELHDELRIREDAIGGLVDVVQKSSAPNSFLSFQPQSKKSKLPN